MCRFNVPKFAADLLFLVIELLLLVLFLKDQYFVWPAIGHGYPASGVNFQDYAPGI